MKLLIVGGAGYIGSHMVNIAQSHGHEVVVLDNFSTGHSYLVRNYEVLNVDILNQTKLSKLLKGRYFDGVVHFAAKSQVGESMKTPNTYYANNVSGTINLVNEMLRNDISNIVFSSSAAVYGLPNEKKITESSSLNPINPYGKSKLYVENILYDMCMSYDMNAVCLRYFNAAGADPSSAIGEDHNPETHLIPCILNSVLENTTFKIYGNNYSTPDGTCIRDYVHVNDLANAHLLSLEFMKENPGFSCFNLGNGNGFSVMEIILACEKICGKKIHYNIKERRDGDPDELVANSDKACNLLKWKPDYTSIEDIINTAWLWHKKKHDSN